MIAGSIWVEGTELHWINASGTEYKLTGDNAGAVAGVAGSIWITGSNSTDGQLHYVDASGNHRYTFSQPQFLSFVPNAIPGSIWIDSAGSASTQLRFISPRTADPTNPCLFYLNSTAA